jgi:uncharacterized membrane protein (UPF0127 family)
MARARGTLTLRREDGRVVCEHVDVADTLFRRMRGLIGRARLPRGTGMVLRPAWSIHTACMRFPVDIVFLDHEQAVIGIAHDLRPWHTASNRRAREVVELAAGECERRGLRVGDRVEWASRAATDEADVSELEDDASLAPRARRGDVILASSDRRYVKLATFLLDERGIDVIQSVSPVRAAAAVDAQPVGVVVIDGGDELAATMRLASETRARHPDTAIVLVGEGAAERAPSSLPVFDKWNDTSDFLGAVERALDAQRVS